KAIVSPVLHAIAPSRCLYQPTCSEYAYVALSRFGLLRGSRMALRRLARCHPWGKGGLDPVPEHCGGGCRRNVSSPSQQESRHSDRLS
ncbi:MAG: membrane protein insertion efficiency factor YidD, partial [Bryobacteraceae bacterium]